MRWPVVTIFAYLLLGMELTVKKELAAAPGVEPSFIIPFIVFIALSANLIPTLWVAFILGAIIDLSSQPGERAMPILGPHALGYVAGAYLALTMRGVMFRRSPLSMMFLSVIASLLAELVCVTVLTIRATAFGDPAGWHVGAELLRRLLASLYTAMTAGLLGIVLLPMANLFGFPDLHSRRFARRG